MHALLDALGISQLEEARWITYLKKKDEKGKVVEVEEVAGIGERVDQIKNACWVSSFTTPDFNTNLLHMFFSLLTYSLIQLLKSTHREEERLGKDTVIVYADLYFTVFDQDEYREIIVNFKEDAGLRLSIFSRNKNSCKTNYLSITILITFKGILE